MLSFPKGMGRATGLAPPRTQSACMEGLFSCFSSSTTTNTESWPRHLSQPVANTGEAEEAAGMCAIEARHCLLQKCNTTDVEVVKATPYLLPKGMNGQ